MEKNKNKNKKKKKDFKVEIKKMEQRKREEAPVKKDVEISYDSWFHLKKTKIPQQHTKEIIWAYFKSRGLSKIEMAEKYDEELTRYGVKL